MDDDGALTAVLSDRRGRVVSRIRFSEGTAYVDELFLRHVVMLTSDADAAEVTFVVTRVDGRPTRVDRRLWRELSDRFTDATTVLRDLVVVGDVQRWSAASGRVEPRACAA